MGKAHTVTRVEFLKLYEDENIDMVIENCMERLSLRCPGCSARELRIAILDYLTTKLYPLTKCQVECDEYYNTSSLIDRVPKRKKHEPDS